MITSRELLTRTRKKFSINFRSIAIKGINNIRSELKKRGQVADVSYIIKDNKIDFIVEPRQEEITSDEIPAKQAATVFKNFKNIPIELLNQEMSSEFSTVGIEKAMERTQEQAGKLIQDDISKLI